ncbi:cell wall-binding repeat-containing protein [Bacillus sp. 1P10SD]|uniref:cell wall-binding repeat-containing protein n=1 Tax=Bacillus sp. 1P10SD TaxID=3132265 RepID=UPI0039A717AD
MLKKFLIGMTTAVFFGSVGASSSFADTMLTDNNHQNPSVQEINKLLTDSALRHNIPPEIVKTLAFQESGWKQFNDKGEPYSNENGDGGIGIMQVTNNPNFNQNLLETDIQYNIDAGLQILDDKFAGKDGKLPILNSNERDILENWYFAVLAYNGKVPKNSPVIQSDGSRNLASYQERLFEQLDSFYPGIDMSPIPFDFKVSDFTYTENPYLLWFNRDSYQLPYRLLHTTKHSFKSNDIVLSAAGANIRIGPAKSYDPIKKLASGKKEAVTILDSFVYDESFKFDPNINILDKLNVWYKVKLHDGTIGYTAANELQQLGKRLSGSTRFETATAISQEGWPSGADTVVLARGYDFPDALAGTTLAYQLDAPMLLTHDMYLTDTTKQEILRLKAKKVILLGSTDAVSINVENELNGMGLEVQRIGGVNRFDTAVQIADNMPKKGNTAVVAFGYNFPDALTIAPYAAKMGYPIFLSRTDNLEEETKNALKNFDHTIVVGSEDVLSENITKELKDPVRYGGATRFETNFTIVNNLFSGENGKAYIAQGYGFADALTGAVLAAKNNAPLLLSNPNAPIQVPDSIKNALLTKKLHSYNLLGGSDVLGVENELADIYQQVQY